LIHFSVFAQNRSAIINGSIIDENEHPLANVTITILGKTAGIGSNDSGKFQLRVAPERSFALIFTHTGFIPVQKNFYLSPGETEQLTIRMWLSRMKKKEGKIAW
jgi:hypothetical protein